MVLDAGPPDQPVLRAGNREIRPHAASVVGSELMLAAFTIPRATDAPGATVVPARSLFSYFVEIGATTLLLNPNEEPTAELTAPEVALLAEGKTPAGGGGPMLLVPLEEGTVIRFDRPDYEALPRDFVPALRDACDEIAEIERAYVFELTLPSEEPRQVVGLCLDDPSRAESVARRLGDGLSSRVEPFHFIDFHFLDPSLEDTVRQAVAAVFER